MRKLLLYFFGLTVILSVACSDTKNERKEEISSDKIENIPQLGAEFAEHHVIMSGRNLQNTTEKGQNRRP